MNKFDELYNKIINESIDFNQLINSINNSLDDVLENKPPKQPKPPLSQVIKDAIEDEIIANDIQLVKDYETYLPQIEQSVIELLDGQDYWTIDYGKLVDLITDALEDNKLIIY